MNEPNVEGLGRHMREQVGGPESNELRAVARIMTEAVPALVKQLSTLKPGHVHREALVLLERPLLLHALALTGGNQLRAARLLGLNRNTLRKRCRELQLIPPRRVRGPAPARLA
jgi:two-component system nitrogen regulation response regulator GlnG